MKRLRKQSFTLIEMLVAMALLSLIMFALVSLMDQTQKAMSQGVSQMEASEDVQIAMDRIERDLSNLLVLSKRKAWESNNAATITAGDGKLVVYTMRLKKKPEYCKVTYEWKERFTDNTLTGIQDTDARTTHNVLVETVDYLDSMSGSTQGQREQSILLTGVVDSHGAGSGFYVKDDIKDNNRLIITLSVADNATKRIGYARPADARQERLTPNRYNQGGVNLLDRRLKRYSRVIYVNSNYDDVETGN